MIRRLNSGKPVLPRFPTELNLSLVLALPLSLPTPALPTDIFGLLKCGVFVQLWMRSQRARPFRRCEEFWLTLFETPIERMPIHAFLLGSVER